VKKILIAVLVVVLLLLGAVLVVPALVDWNAYKDEIAARVGAATGRPVSIAGDIRLSLLPTPALSLRDARVASLPGAAEPDMIRVRELDVRVAFPALLRGHVEVQSVALIEPVLVYEVLPDGRSTWDFARGTGGDAASGGGGGGFGSSVSFEQVTVRNGTLVYRDAAAGRAERMEKVDARVVAGSLGGPFQVQGTFVTRGVALRGDLTSGRFAEGAAVPLRVSVSLPDTDAALRFAGIISTTGSNGAAGPRAQGDLRAEGSDLGAVLAVLRGEAPAPGPLAQPFSWRTAIDVSAAGAGFGGLEVQVGETRATGSAALRAGAPHTVEAKLALNRLDLDTWMQRVAAAAPRPAANGRAAAAPAAPRADGFALPAGVTGRFELAVDAITYNGGLIRQGRLEAALDNGRLNVDRVSALLPGGSDVVATGALAAANGQPAVDLRLEANADDLRSLLDWLKVDVRAVPADRLRKASLRAQVQGRPERVEVTGIDLRVDTARATGGVAYVDRGRPAYGIRLDVDNLNVDAYLPPPSDAPAPAGAGGGASDGGGGKDGPVPPAVARLLRDVDGTVELAVGSLLWRGVPVQGLRVDASAANGALTLREVRVADVGGVAAQLSGQVGSLAPLRNAHVALSAEAASLAGLTRLVPWPAGAPAPEKFGAVKAQGRLAGDLDKLAVELSADAVGGTLEAGGTLANLQGAVATDLKVRATHPEMARLAALFGKADTGTVGALDLYSEVSVTPRAVALSAMQGTVAGMPVRGKARVDLGGPRPRVQADVQTGDLDADRLLAGPAAASKGGSGGAPAGGAAGGGGESFDLGWMRSFDGRLGLTSSALIAQGTRIDNPAMRLILADGVLTLEQFDGGVLGGQIGATGRLAAPAGRAPEAELNLTVVKAKLAQAFSGGSLDVASGTLDLDAELRTAGAGKTAMLQALSGTARLAGRDGAVRGFDMGALAERLGRLDRPQDALEAVLRGLQGGETRFSRLDGTFAVERGVATTQDLRLISDAGQATAQGQVNLPAETMDMRVRIQAKGDLPPVAVRMTGPIDKPTRAFEMQEVQEFLARRAASGILKQAVPDLPIPVPVPGTSGGARPTPPQDVIRGLIEGLRPR